MCRDKTDEMQRNPKRWIGHRRVTIHTEETTAAGVVEGTFVVAMEIVSTSGGCLRGKGMASGQIWGNSQVMNNACECGTEIPETSAKAKI